MSTEYGVPTFLGPAANLVLNSGSSSAPLSRPGFNLTKAIPYLVVGINYIKPYHSKHVNLHIVKKFLCFFFLVPSHQPSQASTYAFHYVITDGVLRPSRYVSFVPHQSPEGKCSRKKLLWSVSEPFSPSHWPAWSSVNGAAHPPKRASAAPPPPLKIASLSSYIPNFSPSHLISRHVQNQPPREPVVPTTPACQCAETVASPASSLAARARHEPPSLRICRICRKPAAA